jgi:peptidoglycan/LPS O-acetylase OafA/YrhL
LSSARRNEIQALRGLAVLAVIAFHFSEKRFSNGYLGVDIFFLISGYVVAKSLITINESELQVGKVRVQGFMSFLTRRFLRLAPALGLMITFSALLMLLLVPPGGINRFLAQAVFSIFSIGNLGAVIIVGDYFQPSPNPLVHTWSLGVEEQIYFFIGLLFYLQSKRQKNGLQTKWATKSFIGLFIGSMFLFVSVAIWNSQIPTRLEILDTLNFYFWSQRLWEFSLGAILFSITVRASSKTSRLVSTISLLTLCALLFSNNSLFDKNVLIVIVCILTVAAIHFSEFNFDNIFIRGMIFIGDRSYSLYLIHMPILYLIHYSPILSDGRNLKILKVLSIPLILILGMISFRIIENRFRIRTSVKKVDPRLLKRSIYLSLVLPLLTLLTVFTLINSTFFIQDKNPMPPVDPSSLISACKLDPNIEFCSEATQISNPKVLLIGDSHARYLSQTFLDVASMANRMAYISTQSGCEFLLPQFTTEPIFRNMSRAYGTKQRNEQESCFDHNRGVIEFIEQKKNITVFVSLRSSSLAEMDYGIPPDLYNEKLLASLKYLEKRSTKVILIGPNPEFSDGNRFFAGNTLFWQDVYETSARKTAPINNMRTNPLLDTHFFSRKLEGSSIRFIETVSLFCDGSVCRRAEKGIWLYSNVDHLSIEGNMLLAPIIKSEMLF